MAQYKVGVIIVDEQAAFANLNLMAATESLKALGCGESNILVREAPKIFNVTLTTQFLAEYTDVDAVVVLAEDDHTAAFEAMLYGLTKLQIAWNMPVTVGDFTAAAEAIEMVALQNKMEAEAPENITQDSRSIN